MELDEALARRRSIRKYGTDPIPGESVTRIINAAHMAPSGANASPWLYVVVSDSAVKTSIRAASEEVDGAGNADMPAWFQSWLSGQSITREKAFLEDAPCLLVVFSDSTMPYAVESTWISIGYALLAAAQEGLGSLTYTPGDPRFLSSVLNVPRHFVPQAILPIGYPAETPDPALRPKKRYDIGSHAVR